jgi:Na+-driven multidrug efflux pump
VLHSLAIAVALGLAFMLGVLGGGPWLYGAMGGSGPSLSAALTYSNVVFSGAILVWLFNSLANVIRGTGNMAVPAIVTCAGAAALIPISPCLIFGWGPFPQLGIAGGAVAVVMFYALGSLAFVAYLWSGRSVVRFSVAGGRFRWALFWDILRVGAVAALITVATNLTIGAALRLGLDRVGVDFPTAVHRADDPFDPHPAVGADGDLRNVRHVCAEAEDHGVPSLWMSCSRTPLLGRRCEGLAASGVGP